MKEPRQGIDYDDASVDSIMCYALRLQGKTLRQELEMPIDMSSKFSGKGSVGQSVEYYFFGYEPNSISEPDFPKVGLELKATPLKQNKDGAYVPKERLSITMIDYMQVCNEEFENSHLWIKARNLLMMHYLHDSGKDPLDLSFVYIYQWEIPPEDVKMIKDDWELIVSKVQAGVAETLSGADTNYLEAAPKGQKDSALREQPFSGERARPRGFALKPSYVKTMIDRSVNKKAKIAESIPSLDKNESFDTQILGRISQWIGRAANELGEKFELNHKSKAFFSSITYRMLGVKSNRAVEFEKAGITVRTIRREQNGKIIESISFPTFKFSDLIEEEWENSELREQFYEDKYLFVVFQNNGEDYVLKGCSFWGMPVEVLESDVRDCWERTQAIIAQGPKLVPKRKGNRIEISNNLPGLADNPFVHVRPHATKRGYRLEDGSEYGNPEKYGDELPDGRWMTKQCFWLNGSYVSQELADRGM